jgi:hypothetical protein
MPESGFRIRVDDGLRRDFIAACRQRDLTAAQVLRGFMRHFVERTGHALQTDFLDTIHSSKSEHEKAN